MKQISRTEEMAKLENGTSKLEKNHRNKQIKFTQLSENVAKTKKSAVSLAKLAKTRHFFL
ncbi:hypothetical protein D1970_08510 [Mesobacillus zeae]|uniref:Uncharacterized protein n=1 Tax=Mesobacillus zeae TaxID=1917180 RepID=A0A398B7U5_9BACI|nr:hypothetical protein D1970_08510 [Mesobacillus zeae]